MLCAACYYYSCLYEDFKTSAHPVFHYWTQYMIRRLIFACVCYIYWEEQYVYIQIIVNIISS